VRLFFQAWLFFIVLISAFSVANANERTLDARLHHIRCGDQREWSEFPAEAEAQELRIEFNAEAVDRETTLRLRHRDVKQRWTIELNGRSLGSLPINENDTVTFWSVPRGALKNGVNVVRIHGPAKPPDDVMLGDVRFYDRPRGEMLSQARLEVRVRDADSGDPLPSRITLLGEEGALFESGAASSATLAVRPGVAFTADGAASLPMPAGKYKVFAGRGFEYSVASADVELQPGDTKTVELLIRREAPTEGYAACDTHCHTFTHSRHGDATIEERMVTLAAEGIELPVATDHNVQIDYAPVAERMGLRRYFTPITGNEVTTSVGHFNVFPLEPGPPSIDHQGKDWATVFNSIFAGGREPLVVLNHARDLHAGFRPFDPKHHLAVAGERLDGQRLRAGLMEVVNSGTTQSDGLQLIEDWMGLLNRGLKVTPVGASDSHDVARHFVGQGRTYVRCDDRRPGAIDLDEALTSLRAGRVLVSYGLLADLRVADRYGSGDLVPADGPLKLTARVLGPHWTQVERVRLYVNGVPTREVVVAPDTAGDLPRGVKWQAEWSLDRPTHDVFLALVAVGPGIRELYWPTPKPYQPTSPDWTPYVLGVTGPLWIDADRDGRFNSPFEYAEKLVKRSAGDLSALFKELSTYDEAVAIEAASLLAAAGHTPLDEALSTAWQTAAPQVRRGFHRYADSWKLSQQAR
jgi:hypothetical protein